MLNQGAPRSGITMAVRILRLGRKIKGKILEVIAINILVSFLMDELNGGFLIWCEEPRTL